MSSLNKGTVMSMDSNSDNLHQLEALEPRLLLDGTHIIYQPTFIREDIPLGNYPAGIVVEDFNVDGLADLAVTNYRDAYVSILYGQEGGGFTRGEDVAVSDMAARIVSGDFNHDELIDLAVTSSRNNTVSVLYGQENGGFGGKVDVAVGGVPEGIGSADFDDDGWADLVTVNSGSNTVTILYSDMAGSFGSRQDLVVGHHPTAVAIGDFNVDGFDDLAVVNVDDDDVSVLYGQVGGGFADRIDLAVGHYPSHIITDDWNSDGLLDIAVANGSSDTVSLLYGDTGGGFGARQDMAVSASPNGLTSSDLNGDGLNDIAVANWEGGTVSILYNQSGGVFVRGDDVTVGGWPVRLVSEDFNSDGLQDLAVTSHYNQIVTILYAQGAVVATDDAYSVNEDTILSVPSEEYSGVLANDTGAGNILTAQLVTPASHGNVNLNSDGSFTYSPEPNFNGIDQFVYQAIDGQQNKDNATVTITVNAVSDPLVITAPDSVVGEEDNPVPLLGIAVSDAGVDPNTAIVDLSLTVEHGTLSLDEGMGIAFIAGFNHSHSMTLQGTVTEVNASLNTLTYQGYADFSGLDRLTVTATMAGDTWTVSPVVNTTANERSPIWSPDGTQLAYISDESGYDELWVLGQGGTAWQVTDLKASVQPLLPTWTPDSRGIMYCYGGLGSDPRPINLAIAWLDETRTSVSETWYLTSNSGLANWEEAVISPDGSKIAAPLSIDGWPTIYTMNLDPDGSGKSSIGQPAFAGHPTWGPVGPNGEESLIAYSHNSYPGGPSDIWVIQPNGQGDHEIIDRSQTNTHVHALAWAPVGDRIAFSSPYDLTSRLGVVNTDGSGLTWLDEQAAFINQAYGGLADIWSKDGQSLVYSRWDSDNWNVYIIGEDGNGKTLVAATPGDDLSARFRSDGAIYFETYVNGNHDIYLASRTMENASAVVSIEINAVADAPILNVANAQGDEDTAIPLSIDPSLADTDGSESLAITISGVPAGATLSAGVDNGDGSWTLSPSDLAGLTITPPANSDADFTLTVTATATEAENGDTATTSQALPVTVYNLADLSGYVFNDLDNDGVKDEGEEGIAGVEVQLVGDESQGNSVSRITVTDADGAFVFDDLRPGMYDLIETVQPIGYLDGTDTAGTLGGIVLDPDVDQIRDIQIAQDNPDATGYTFAEILPSMIQGMVWEDYNNDGEINFGEKAIANATVTLSGNSDRGAIDPIQVMTDEQGIYRFQNLRPSDSAGYTITETQPEGYDDGVDVLGTVNGVPTGENPVNDQLTGVVLPQPDSLGENYNFGERPTSSGEVTPGQTATIGFWQNKNGQNLIKALNGGSASTQLGDWLAATFPNMYGEAAGYNNLAGLTNTQIADFYSQIFHYKKAKGDPGPAKLDAQVLAVSLAVYVTNSRLAGSTATSYGFTVTENGVGYTTFNVGTNGAAFGVDDYSNIAVLNLLLATNERTTSGLLYDLNGDGNTLDEWETIFRQMANEVYTAINEQGDI